MDQLLSEPTDTANVDTRQRADRDRWYKQDVYDRNNAKIGQIMDVLVDKSGKISALIIGIGGFLDAGEKDVAVPFEEVQATTKNNKVHLVMNATKDALQKRTWFQVRQQHHDLGSGFPTKSDPHPEAGLGRGLRLSRY
jgi:sporulation protein YlmC with PRC-barrel domain